MTTVVEALQDATAELHNAAVALLGARDGVNAQLGQTTTSLQNFVSVATAPSRTWIVDPINGNDANDGLTQATAVKTLDYVLGAASPATRHFVLLLGNTQINKRYNVSGIIQIVGALLTPGQPNPYIGTMRTISFAAEATNSPQPFAGRCSGGISLLSATVTMDQINLVLPDVPAVLDSFYQIAGAGDSSFVLAGTINGTTPSNPGKLFKNNDASPFHVWVNGSFAGGLAGRIFSGVAAGANPNTGGAYQTNITSA